MLIVKLLTLPVFMAAVLCRRWHEDHRAKGGAPHHERWLMSLPTGPALLLKQLIRTDWFPRALIQMLLQAGLVNWRHWQEANGQEGTLVR